MKENILLLADAYRSFVLSSGLIRRLPLPEISTAVKVDNLSVIQRRYGNFE